MKDWLTKTNDWLTKTNDLLTKYAIEISSKLQNSFIFKILYYVVSILYNIYFLYLPFSIFSDFFHGIRNGVFSTSILFFGLLKFICVSMLFGSVYKDRLDTYKDKQIDDKLIRIMSIIKVIMVCFLLDCLYKELYIK